MNVIDYSLLVGIDEESQELVVGVVGKEKNLSNLAEIFLFGYFSCFVVYVILLIFFFFNVIVAQITFGRTHGTRNWRVGSRRQGF